MEAANFGGLIAWLIWSVIWGVVVGLLAKRKNRNPWGWGMAGAMSLLLALIVLAFMPYKCPKCSQPLTSTQAKGKECPSCGSFKPA